MTVFELVINDNNTRTSKLCSSSYATQQRLKTALFFISKANQHCSLAQLQVADVCTLSLSVCVTSPDPHVLTFPLPVSSADKSADQCHQGQNEEKKSLLMSISSHNLVVLFLFADLLLKTKTQFTVLFQIRSAAISCWIALKCHGFLQRIRFFFFFA